MEHAILEVSPVVTEIRMWLFSSRLFFRELQVERHLGSQWFVINQVLTGTEEADSVSFRDLYDGLPPESQEGSSLHHDLSACLDDLRGLKYVDVLESGKPTSLGARSSFPVSVEIKARDKLRVSIRRFIRAVLREFFGVSFAEVYRDKSVKVLGVLYDFAAETFLTDWVAVQKALTLRSTIQTGLVRRALEREMTGSTEFFVILHSLWELSILGDDEGGFRREMIKSIHRFTRQVPESKFDYCVDKLIKHGILEKVHYEDDEPHFRLARRHLVAFDAYAERLPQYRAMLRQKIEHAAL